VAPIDQEILDDSVYQKTVKHHNEIVICAGVFYSRLIGLCVDDEDYYYHVVDMDGNQKFYSCLMGFEPLKGALPDDRYNTIETLFQINKSPRREFIFIDERSRK